MRRSALAVAALALVAPVAAADDWAGTWAADPAWCGNDAGDSVPIVITVDEMQGLGNICAITNVSPVGVGRSWRFDMNCSGEGTPYRTSELIMMTRAGDLVRYTDDGGLVRMVRCE